MDEFYNDQLRHLDRIEIKREDLKEQEQKNIDNGIQLTKQCNAYTSNYYERVKKSFAGLDRSMSPNNFIGDHISKQKYATNFNFQP